jgi:hypothetical protein
MQKTEDIKIDITVMREIIEGWFYYSLHNNGQS